MLPSWPDKGSLYRCCGGVTDRSSGRLWLQPILPELYTRLGRQAIAVHAAKRHPCRVNVYLPRLWPVPRFDVVLPRQASRDGAALCPPHFGGVELHLRRGELDAEAARWISKAMCVAFEFFGGVYRAGGGDQI